MDDLALIRAIDRGGDWDFGARRCHQHASIPRLAAASGVEHRPAQNDPAALIDPDDLRLRFDQIGIVAEERGRGHGVSSKHKSGSRR